MTVIAIDPGKSTGWSTWTDTGELEDHGILLLDDFFEWLMWQHAGTWVYESFILDYRAGKQVGSHLEASQAIGAMKLRAKQNTAVAIPQRTEARDMGYVHSGISRARRHADSHDLDAIAHGYYYFETLGIIPMVGKQLLS